MNYFLAPRSGEKSYINFTSTIKHGVPFERIESHLSDEEKGILKREEVLYVWGSGEGTRSVWEKMKNGDTVLFYSRGRFVLTGEVYFKKNSPELALAMWPAADNGKSWENTFFLRNLKYISIPIRAFNSIVGYKPKFVVQGFMRLKEDPIAKIIDQFSSVEAMLDVFLDRNSEEVPHRSDVVYVNLSKTVQPILLEDIKLKPKVLVAGTKFSASKKVDYEKKNRSNAITGSKGEALILEIERDRLNKSGRHDLAKKVKQVSIGDDSLGYDILSYEEDGKERYIEVKTTISNNDGLYFHVTSNEYRAGHTLSNYYIYFVQNINSENPKISMISHPMDKEKFLIIPDGYIFNADCI